MISHVCLGTSQFLLILWFIVIQFIRIFLNNFLNFSATYYNRIFESLPYLLEFSLLFGCIVERLVSFLYLLKEQLFVPLSQCHSLSPNFLYFCSIAGLGFGWLLLEGKFTEIELASLWECILCKLMCKR